MMGGSANAFSLGRKHNFRSQSALPCSSCAQFGASLHESKTDHLQKLWLEPGDERVRNNSALSR